MTDETDPEVIRERKREELKRRLSDEGGQDEAADDGAADSPSEPAVVRGAEELSSFVDRHGVVLADFHAEWCGPCKMMEPVVESIAAETDAAVAKVDVDDNQALAAEYGVRGVPTFVAFRDGEPVERLVGGQDESRLRAVLGV